MRNLAFGALFVGLIACGNSSNNKKVIIVDGPNGDTGGVCNPLTQTGCNTGEKCTWIIDMDDPNFAGHVGCAPDGTMATGAACTRNPPGPTGYDDCVHGNYCFGPNAGGAGTCKLICDENGGAPMCPTNFGCVPYQEIFQEGTNPATAGVCEPTCDPLNDNNFLGSNGTKTGTACSATRGCSGFPPDFNSSSPTVFTCAPIANPTRIHRSACTGTQQPGDAAACLDQGKYIYPNSCAAGYQPLLLDAEGSMQQDCIAMCAAQDCYAGTGNCPGSAFAGGSAGGVSHTCYAGNGKPNDIAVDPAATFVPATATNNGEQCNYLWNLEFDASGMFVRSATSDTLGLCVNRGLYFYDSNGDGMVTTTAGTDQPWPACNTITSLNSGSAGAAGSCPANANGQTNPTGTTCCIANGCLGADGTPANTVYGPFACVSATKAGMPATGKGSRAVKSRFPMLRMPYNRSMLKGID